MTLLLKENGSLYEPLLKFNITMCLGKLNTFRKGLYLQIYFIGTFFVEDFFIKDI